MNEIYSDQSAADFERSSMTEHWYPFVIYIVVTEWKSSGKICTLCNYWLILILYGNWNLRECILHCYWWTWEFLGKIEITLCLPVFPVSGFIPMDNSSHQLTEFWDSLQYAFATLIPVNKIWEPLPNYLILQKKNSK